MKSLKLVVATIVVSALALGGVAGAAQAATPDLTQSELAQTATKFFAWTRIDSGVSKLSYVSALNVAALKNAQESAANDKFTINNYPEGIASYTFAGCGASGGLKSTLQYCSGYKSKEDYTKGDPSRANFTKKLIASNWDHFGIASAVSDTGTNYIVVLLADYSKDGTAPGSSSTDVCADPTIWDEGTPDGTTTTITIDGVDTVCIKGTTTTAPEVQTTAQKFTGKVKVTGAAKVGKKLTAKKTGYPSGTKFIYRWTASGKNIKGATHSTLKLTKKLAGKHIRVKVTAKKSNYVKKTVTSAATKRVIR